MKNKTAGFSGFFIVGAVGFEPTAFATPLQRASRTAPRPGRHAL